MLTLRDELIIKQQGYVWNERIQVDRVKLDNMNHITDSPFICSGQNATHERIILFADKSVFRSTLNKSHDKNAEQSIWNPNKLERTIPEETMTASIKDTENRASNKNSFSKMKISGSKLKNCEKVIDPINNILYTFNKHCIMNIYDLDYPDLGSQTIDYHSKIHNLSMRIFKLCKKGKPLNQIHSNLSKSMSNLKWITYIVKQMEHDEILETEQYRSNVTYWSRLKYLLKKKLIFNHIGCYIPKYNLIYFMGTNQFDRRHFLFDSKTKKLINVFLTNKCKHIQSATSAPKNKTQQLLYNEALDRLLFIDSRDFTVSYADIDGILSTKKKRKLPNNVNITWKSYSKTSKDCKITKMPIIGEGIYRPYLIAFGYILIIFGGEGYIYFWNLKTNKKYRGYNIPYISSDPIYGNNTVYLGIAGKRDNYGYFFIKKNDGKDPFGDYINKYEQCKLHLREIVPKGLIEEYDGTENDDLLIGGYLRKIQKKWIVPLGLLDIIRAYYPYFG